MRIRKIDKEILDQFFPNKMMRLMQATPDKRLRAFTNNEDGIALFIGEKSASKEVVNSFTRLMQSDKRFHVVISHYKDKILVLLTLIQEPPKPKTLVVEEEFDDDDDCSNQDEMPYAYTNGRWTPCPYCGSDRITTFWDGTAQCDDCKREFTYWQF